MLRNKNKTSATTAKAPAIGICNLAVSTNSENIWKHEEAGNFMCSFDAQNVAKELEDQLGNKCRISKHTGMIIPNSWKFSFSGPKHNLTFMNLLGKVA